VTADACAADCYAEVGYVPVCTSAILLSGSSTDPDTRQLFPSECAAKCKAEAFSGVRRSKGYEVEYAQQPLATCEQEWKTNVAATYQYYSTLRQYEPYIEAPAPWLQQEINANSSELQEALAVLESGEVEAELGPCFVCNPALKLGTFRLNDSQTAWFVTL
jgi:hypothetical protein